jgi:adenylyltransferase/sulfurtransferase
MALSPEHKARYARQILLAEIGPLGQERLLAARAAVAPPGGPSTPLAHEIATRYAERAGFGSVVPGSIDHETLAPDEAVRHPAAKAVLAGSRAVLAAMRRVLG